MKNTIKLIIACFIAAFTLISCAYDGEIHTELASLYPESSLKGWQITKNNTGLCGNYSNLTQLDPTKVGYISNNTLYINIPNITISDKIIEYPIVIEVSNVTIRHCLIIPANSLSQGVPIIQVGDATVSDSDIDCTLVPLDVYGACIAVSGENCIIERCNIRGGGTGLSIQNTSDLKISVAQGNHIYDLQTYNHPVMGTNHIDGVTIRISNGLGVIVRNNNIQIEAQNPSDATGPLFIQALQGHIDNVLTEGNLLQGYGYAIGLDYNAHGYGHNMQTKNNRIDSWNGSNWAAAISGGPGWHIWIDNYLYNKDAVSYRGAIVQKP